MKSNISGFYSSLKKRKPLERDVEISDTEYEKINNFMAWLDYTNDVGKIQYTPEALIWAINVAISGGGWLNYTNDQRKAILSLYNKYVHTPKPEHKKSI